MGKEEQTKSWQCHYDNIFGKISKKISYTLENGFYRWGALVVKWPWVTILSALVVCVALTGGMLLFRTETDEEKLWTPFGSPFIEQKAWIAKYFPRDRRYEILIATADNVLTADTIKYLFKIDDKIRNARSKEDNSTFEDLCFSYPSIETTYKRNQKYSLDADTLEGEVKKCITSGVLGLFQNGTDDLNDVNVRETVTAALKDPATKDELGQTLSGVVWDSGTGGVGSVTLVQGFMMIWLLKENSTNPSVGDPRAEQWEMQFIDATIDNPPEKPEELAGLIIHAIAERSYNDEIDGAVNSNYLILSIGFVILFVYVASVLGNLNWIEQKVLLSLCGMIVVGMALGAAFGSCFYSGLLMNDMCPIIPFLLLGIGVDDMFIIVQSLNNLDAATPADEKVALAMKHAGVSITVTSITDMAAFLIGSSSSMPILRTFCLFSSAGVFFLYIFAITFFVGCLTLDQRRQMNQIAARPEWNPPKWTRIQPGAIFFKKLSKWILWWPAQIFILIAAIGLAAVGIYGVLHLESDYDSIWYMRQDSYQVKYYEAMADYFPSNGERVDVYLGDINYETEAASLIQMNKYLESNPYISDNTVDFWYNSFITDPKSLQCIKDFASIPVIGFKSCIGVFLIENINYFQDVKLTIDITDTANLANLWMGNFDITASRAKFQHESLDNTTIKNAAMDQVKDDMNNITFQKEDFTQPIPYSFMYIQWEANKVMSTELIRNLSLSFGTIAVISLVLITDIVVSFFVFICVVMTIAEIAGCAYFMGLTIEIVTSIILILSVGLGLDYIAHIGVTYVVTTGSKKERASTALAVMGSAVFNGGFSTFLAFVLLAGSDSYVFLTFFKMFASVVLFGQFHGLLVLPTILSLVGPADNHNTDSLTHLNVEKGGSLQNGCEGPNKDIESGRNAKNGYDEVQKDFENGNGVDTSSSIARLGTTLDENVERTSL